MSAPDVALTTEGLDSVRQAPGSPERRSTPAAERAWWPTVPHAPWRTRWSSGAGHGRWSSGPRPERAPSPVHPLAVVPSVEGPVHPLTLFAAEERGA